MCQLSVDAKHAGCAKGALVDKVAIDKCSDVETPKVPDDIENVVESASYEVICTQDYRENRRKTLVTRFWHLLVMKSSCAFA